jgi:hypothetical protein
MRAAVSCRRRRSAVNGIDGGPPDVWLIDDQQNQPPSGGVLVRRVAGRRRWRIGSGGGDERNPFGADHTPRRAVHEHDEFFGAKIGDRPAAIVHDSDVH